MKKIDISTVIESLTIAFWIWLAYHQTIAAAENGNAVTFLLALESATVGYFLLKRKPEQGNPHPWYVRTIILFAAFLGPLFVEIKSHLPWWGNALSAAGVVLTLWALWSLNTAFGIAPSDRGLVIRGPYRYIRHPMYAGALLNLMMVVVFNLTLFNVALVIAIFAIDFWRISLEERTVGGYSDYMNQVRWRLIPFIW